LRTQPKAPGKSESVKEIGKIGDFSFETCDIDMVRVSAQLESPAYCYLLALDPDGTVKLCPKAEAHTEPKLVTEIRYPAKTGYYELTGEAGAQAFVLVASRTPLPPFEMWDGKPALAQYWKHATTDGVCIYDGYQYTPKHRVDRGEEREHAEHPRPFEDVCKYLTKRSDVEAISAIVFPVTKQETAQANNSTK
jgi:hypothetical protein